MHLPSRCFNTQQGIGKQFAYTKHARARMSHRAIRAEAINAVLTYGRVVYVRGAYISALGRKEVEHYASEGIDLSAYEGTQVVVTPCGQIVTVYRNRDFRSLRPRATSRRRGAA
jgi:hypothetical protein